MTRKNSLEAFSSGYFIVTRKIRIIEWSRDYAVAAADLYRELEVDGGPVIIKTGTNHWRLRPEHRVPANTIAVPEVTGTNEERDILVARPGHAEFLLGV